MSPKTPKQKTKSKKKTVSNFKYEIDNNLVYIGHVHIKQHGQKCVVLEKHRKHIEYYYKIQFQDENIIDTAEASLKTIEEYEEYLSEIENKKNQIQTNDSNNIYDSYNNYDATLNPVAFYEMRCHECIYEPKCVYKNKYNYNALKSLR